MTNAYMYMQSSIHAYMFLNFYMFETALNNAGQTETIENALQEFSRFDVSNSAPEWMDEWMVATPPLI